MNPGLVYDHDALPEVCDQKDTHVSGCPCAAGGDPEYVTGPLSMLRCSECGDLLDFGECATHGPLDPDPSDGPYNTAGGHEHWDEGREGDPAFNGAFRSW